MLKGVQEIEGFFQRRYNREAIYVPSGRLGLYVAFKEWLQPGHRVLMSPVNDDVVFFTVLAAGLTPVISPVDPATGNIDPEAVDDITWRGLSAVLTTNLYGIPDRMDTLIEICRERGLLLIEDACQALDSTFCGRRVGSFSSVAVFSLSKHIAGVGGVLAFSDSYRRPSVLARVQAEILSPTLDRVLWARMKQRLRLLAQTTGTLETLRRLRRCWFRATATRPGHRMEYVLADVQRARAAGCGLVPFDNWVGIDNRGYRTAPSGWSVAYTLKQLRTFEDNRQQRIAGAERLLALGLTPRTLPIASDVAPFRVPLFVSDREEVLRKFAQHGLTLDYIYDPPLNLYASPDLAETVSSAVGWEHWSRNVLPVDPTKVDQFFKLLPMVALSPAI